LHGKRGRLLELIDAPKNPKSYSLTVDVAFGKELIRTLRGMQRSKSCPGRHRADQTLFSQVRAGRSSVSSLVPTPKKVERF